MFSSQLVKFLTLSKKKILDDLEKNIEVNIFYGIFEKRNVFLAVRQTSRTSIFFGVKIFYGIIKKTFLRSSSNFPHFQNIYIFFFLDMRYDRNMIQIRRAVSEEIGNIHTYIHTYRGAYAIII